MAKTKAGEGSRKKAFGVSLDETTVELIDALADATYPGGGRNRRSMFIQEALELGLSQRFGPNWRLIADRMRSAEVIPA